MRDETFGSDFLGHDGDGDGVEVIGAFVLEDDVVEQGRDDGHAHDETGTVVGRGDLVREFPLLEKWSRKEKTPGWRGSLWC